MQRSRRRRPSRPRSFWMTTSSSAPSGHHGRMPGSMRPWACLCSPRWPPTGSSFSLVPVASTPACISPWRPGQRIYQKHHRGYRHGPPRRGGTEWLLADDDSTPQAFLRSLSLYVPSNYADMAPEEQDHIRRQLAFTAQRGWFYEEWGQHLEAMMQKNGYMAGFRRILRRLDDHKARYASNTIARGREILHKPYVSLLANVTPSDLQPFVKAQLAALARWLYRPVCLCDA